MTRTPGTPKILPIYGKKFSINLGFLPESEGEGPKVECSGGDVGVSARVMDFLGRKKGHECFSL